jgi:hypothetical protein
MGSSRGEIGDEKEGGSPGILGERFGIELDFLFYGFRSGSSIISLW